MQDLVIKVGMRFNPEPTCGFPNDFTVQKITDDGVIASLDVSPHELYGFSFLELTQSTTQILSMES
jgi:hypothetical protein